MEELILKKENIKNIVNKKPAAKKKVINKEVDLNKNEQLINHLIIREQITIDVKGKPMSTLIPIPLSLLIVEINYLFDINILDELQLNDWFDEQNNRDLSYYYAKFLIAWKVLTNDIKMFSPVGSKIEFNILSELKFDSEIPQELIEAMECEKIEYD